MPLFVIVAFLVVYALCGFVISTLYTFLASGGSEAFATTALLAPLVVFLLVITYLSEWRRRPGKLVPRFGSLTFWAFVIYFLLPVLMNGASILFRTLGWSTVSRLCFDWRYGSLVAVPVLFVAYCVFDEKRADWRRRRNQEATFS